MRKLLRLAALSRRGKAPPRPTGPESFATALRQSVATYNNKAASSAAMGAGLPSVSGHSIAPPHLLEDLKLQRLPTLRQPENVAGDGRGTVDLLRAYFVLKICTKPIFTRNSEQLLRIAGSVLGEQLTNALIRSTFFDHFCSGENAQEVCVAAEKLKAQGISTILAYAVEMGLDDNSADDPPINQEACFDENARYTLECIRTARCLKNDGFVAVKLTALVDPELLFQLSKLLDTLRVELKKALNYSKVHATAISSKQLCDIFTMLGLDATPEECQRLEALASTVPTPAVGDSIIRQIPLSDLGTALLRSQKGTTDRSRVTVQHIQGFLARINEIGREAGATGIRLIIDAEQTYLQHAIDVVTTHLQRKHNAAVPIVYNSLQSYRKDSTDRLKIEMAIARSEGWRYGIKVVRGAYMEEERQRSQHLSYDDPIHASVDATHDCYDRNVETVLESIHRGDRVEMLVATHNESSVRKASAFIDQLGIPRAKGGVVFGQLQGLSDHITYSLAENGFACVKYVPYGPVDRAIPYLIRRANENLAVLTTGGRKDLEVLSRQIAQRLGWRRVLRHS